MYHGNKELTAVFTRFYQALLIIMHIFKSFIEVKNLKKNRKNLKNNLDSRERLNYMFLILFTPNARVKSESLKIGLQRQDVNLCSVLLL